MQNINHYKMNPMKGQKVHEVVSYPYFSQSQLWSNLGLPDLSLGIDATPDLVRPSPAP